MTAGHMQYNSKQFFCTHIVLTKYVRIGAKLNSSVVTYLH